MAIEDHPVNILCSFSGRDNVFAANEKSIKSARDVLKDFWEFGYSFADYIATLEQYLKEDGCSEEHIKVQLERIRNIESYF